MNLALPSLLGLPMFLRPFGLHCNAGLVFYLCPSSLRVVATVGPLLPFEDFTSVLMSPG